MIVDLIKEYLWIIMLLFLIGISTYKSKKSTEAVTWKNTVKLGPTFFFFFIAAIDWSRDNVSGVIVDLKLAGIVLAVYAVLGLVNICRTSKEHDEGAL